MPQVRWHKLSFACPTCGKQALLLEVDAAADGEISIGALCPTCGKTLEFKTDIQKIIATCVQADVLCPLEEDMENDP
jgi:endogenous inhibitor of DNA gyrase (YacG/DUF329 family)